MCTERISLGSDIFIAKSENIHRSKKLFHLSRKILSEAFPDQEVFIGIRFFSFLAYITCYAFSTFTSICVLFLKVEDTA